MEAYSKMHPALYGDLPSRPRAGGSTESMRRIIEQSLDGSYTPDKGRLLELGCKEGEIALWLMGKGWEACGVDISPEAIRKAGKKAAKRDGKGEFRVGNAVFLWGWEDASFDLVLDGHCLQSLVGEDRLGCLKSAFRVLKPGGCLLVCTECGPHVRDGLRGYDRESSCQLVKGKPVRYFGRPADITAEIEQAGFTMANLRLLDAPEGGQDRLVATAIKPLIEGNQFPATTSIKKPAGWTAGRRRITKPKKD